MNRVKKIKNPCDNCMVKPCCSSICYDKEFYTEEIILELTRATEKVSDSKCTTVYPDHRITTINRNYSKLRSYWSKICELNRKEINKILRIGLDYNCKKFRT